MIKHSLQLRLSQQLAMTPQLQQAIRLLQLSTFELKQEIQLALENNPLLEQVDLPDGISIPEAVPNEDWETFELHEHMEILAEQPLKSIGGELFSAAHVPANKISSLIDERPIYQGETVQTLQDYLMWQVQLTPFSEMDLVIAIAIVDAIDESGYLTLPLEEILTSLGDDDITLDEVKTVLKRIQHFDPVGVAAQDLRDALRIQLSQLPSHTPYLLAARLIVEHHLEQLAHHDFRALMRLSKLNETILKSAIRLIRTLNPHPGLALPTRNDTFVIPDILVHKHQGQWVVEFNQESLPSLKINSHYAQIDTSSCNDRDNQFIRSHLQEAKWLLKNLESRNETLLKVSRCIVEQQQDFFEHGTEYMKPMVLTDIAQKVDLHESTVSRATTQKFMHSPRGLFELKYFFSSHVNTEDGGEASSTAIRALVKKLVATENPSKPLSDSKLAMLLAEQGILVARRTVAKYRESLCIPPSNQRKQLI